MQTVVDEAINARKTLNLADQVFERFDPDQFGRDAPRADMDAYARELVDGDPEDLAALRAEIAFRTGQYEDQAKDGYAADFDTAYEVAMSEPGRLQGLPAFRRLDASDRDSLLRDVRRRAQGEAVETNLQEYATIMDMIDAGSAREAREHLYANAGQFTPADFKSLRGKVSSALGGDGGGLDSIRPVTAVARDSLRSAGIDDDPEVRGELVRAYDHWQLDFQRTEGRDPPRS